MILPDDLDLDQPRDRVVEQLVAAGPYDRPAAEAVVALLLGDDVDRSTSGSSC